LKDGKFHHIIYNPTGSTTICSDGQKIGMDDCVPDKRVYSEACDYEFCKLLINYGVSIPFLSHNPDRPKQQFYGKVI